MDQVSKPEPQPWMIEAISECVTHMLQCRKPIPDEKPCLTEILAKHCAASQPSVPAMPDELKPLLDRLQAANVHGAMLQLDDHFAADARMVETLRSVCRERDELRRRLTASTVSAEPSVPATETTQCPTCNVNDKAVVEGICWARRMKGERADPWHDSQSVPSSQGTPPQDAGFDEATEKRWQDAIYEVCKQAVGADNYDLIDGGGTDSGDALDFTLTEIGQAIGFWRDKSQSTGWVSVEERLPEKFEQVFACMKPVAEGPNWYPRTNVTLAWHKRGIWFGAFIDPMSGKVENGEVPEGLITHWRVLPTPPLPGPAEEK